MNTKDVMIDIAATKMKISWAHESLLPIRRGRNIKQEDIFEALEHLESAYKRLVILEERIKDTPF